MYIGLQSVRIQLCLDISMRLSGVGPHDVRSHSLGGERKDSEVLWAPIPEISRRALGDVLLP